MSDVLNITTDKSASGLKGAFKKACAFAGKNRLQTTAILGSILLGTTTLTTPLLATTMTAGLLMIGSCLLLAKSSDALIDHAAAIGGKMKLSPLLIGLALGALTSMPELFVSVGSIFKGVPELGIGNIVGSNIANILLILGATAAISGIQKGKGLGWKFNNLAMIGTTFAFGAQLATGALRPVAGMAMLGLGGLYMVGSYLVSKKDMAQLPENKQQPEQNNKDQNDVYHPNNMPGWFNGAWGLAGLGGLIYSADILINSATRFATGLGVSQALVGALAVAVGTSLPELVVNIKTARRNETDMALGNILGSNIFNVLMVGGAVALAGTTIPSGFAPNNPQGLLNFGAFGVSAALLATTLHKNDGGLKKWHGWTAMGLYAAFVVASMALDSGAPTAPTQSKGPQVQHAPMVLEFK